MSEKDTVYGISVEDRGALLWLIVLPFVLAAPALFGVVRADPLLYTGGMTLDYMQGFLRGSPFIDPNNGYGTQALGRRAMLDWLAGAVPWWNHYSGVGLPLAGEYQPGAFFPLTALLLLPQGPVLLQVSLQILTGVGTYGLLRQLGLRRSVALPCALLYAFNGTLAWHAHAPASAVPFLPWMLWGVERLHASVRLGLRPSWRLLATAMVLGLLCSFPETSYLSGLLALAWAILRGLQLEPANRLAYLRGVTVGGLVGIAISAPQLHAFFHFLFHAHIGGHGTEFARASFPWHAMASHLVAPHFLGPIFAYADRHPLINVIWGGIGGFVTLGVVCAAAYGLAVKRDPLNWLLAGWLVFALGRTFGLEVLVTLANWIPGVSYTAFVRYAPPSWALALVVLAARGIEELSHSGPRRAGVAAAVVAACMGIALCAATAKAFWPELRASPGLRNSAAAAVLLAALTSVAVIWILARGREAARSRLAALLVAEAMVMTFIPSLSNPRRGVPDFAAIDFLRGNLGYQRFYTLGPIQPNYGAYFSVASINHNYLPVARRWVEWVEQNLDREVDPVTFTGNFPRPRPGAPSQVDELRRNLAAYQWVGVKYVVSFAGQSPLAGVPGVRREYQDAILAIDALPAPKPYFETIGGSCKLVPASRNALDADCAGPVELVRRELYFPGWAASVRGAPAEIAEHGNLFQAVRIPPGRSRIEFAYAPPGVGWSWLAAALGLLALGGSGALKRAPRWAPQNRSAS